MSILFLVNLATLVCLLLITASALSAQRSAKRCVAELQSLREELKQLGKR